VASIFPSLHATFLGSLASILAVGQLPIIFLLLIWGTKHEAPPTADAPA
jgi:hypothetical protein